MGAERVTVPKGMRDFSPLEMLRRGHIFDTVRGVFALFGYAALETPSMENLSTLLGKYGDEGDKLLYRVLNSGDFLRDVPTDVLHEGRSETLVKHIADRGMRYDLTVPFARYVSQNWQQLPRPFKRYQIQPVWRADRPQKGRYREFYQCDVDVVGSESLMCELELLQIVEAVFGRLGLQVTIHINNRKVLAALADRLGKSDQLVDMTVAIDKMEKVGVDGVRTELLAKGFSPTEIETLVQVVSSEGSNEERLAVLEGAIAGSPMGELGISEVRSLLQLANESGLTTPLVLDLSLARGLNYYTGAIFEVKAQGVSIGSVCGGGRYDNLTAIFGLDGVSGVGISFGADRIYDAMLEKGLFPTDVEQGLDVLILNTPGEDVRTFALQMAKVAREFGLRAMVYPDAAKFRKQMDYANRRGVRLVIIAGEDEWARGEVSIKDLQSGEQHLIPKGEVPQRLGQLAK